MHGSVSVEISLLMKRNASYFHHTWGNAGGLVKIRAWRNRSGSSSNPHWNNEGNKFESLFASIARYWTPLVCTWEDGMIIQNSYVKHLCVLFLHSRMDLKRLTCDRVGLTLGSLWDRSESFCDYFWIMRDGQPALWNPTYDYFHRSPLLMRFTFSGSTFKERFVQTDFSKNDTVHSCPQPATTTGK